MLIPVKVQKPNLPQTGRFVGHASEDLTAQEVADRVGVPDGCLIDGKIVRRKGEKHWSLVANVGFRIRVRNENDYVCPHCGKGFQV